MNELKRTIPSLLIAVILVLGAWYLSKNESVSRAPSVAGVKKANFQIAEIDSDSDGLMDWEERLWKTDSTKTDSDGDGTSDGDEVSGNRDPAVKGPNDSLREVTLSENSGIKAITEDKSLNVSEAVSRSIFSAYLESQNKGSVSASQLEALQILMAEKLPPQKVYFLSDLSISSADSADSFKLYGNNLASILESREESEAELTIFARAIDTSDKKELEKLDPIIKYLGDLIDRVVNLSVPKSVAEAHLSLVSNLDAVKYDIAGMKLVFDDPMLAFMALNSYRYDSEVLLEDLEAIKEIVKKSGAVFGSTEAGYKIFGR